MTSGAGDAVTVFVVETTVVVTAVVSGAGDALTATKAITDAMKSEARMLIV